MAEIEMNELVRRLLPPWVKASQTIMDVAGLPYRTLCVNIVLPMTMSREDDPPLKTVLEAQEHCRKVIIEARHKLRDFMADKVAELDRMEG